MLSERLGRLGPRERLGLAAALAFLAFLLLDRLVTQHMTEQYKRLDMQIENETATLEYHESVLSVKDAIQDQFDAIRERIGESLPPAEATVLIEGQIDALAKESDMDLRSIQHREPRQADYYHEYFVDIGDFETDESGLLRFLHGLRGLAGTFQVASLSVSPDSSGKLVKGSMTITKVMMPPAEPPPEG